MEKKQLSQVAETTCQPEKQRLPQTDRNVLPRGRRSAAAPSQAGDWGEEAGIAAALGEPQARTGSPDTGGRTAAAAQTPPEDRAQPPGRRAGLAPARL